MPWSVKNIDGKYCVVKEGETSPISGGCHGVKSEAAAHVRALYASEAEHAVSELYTEEVDMDTELEEDLEEFGCSDCEEDSFEFSDTMKEYAWSGPIVFENVTTGDNRVFKADSINWQEDTLPWAFRWQKASGQGHAGSVPIGRVDRIERKEDGSIHGFGVIIPELSTEATEYFKILKAGVGGGVSVDGDSAEFEVQEQEKGQPRVEFSSMRLRALSAVDIPAFNGARIHLIEDEKEDKEVTDGITFEQEEPEEVIDLQEELADKKPFPFEKKEEGKDEEEDEEEDSEDSEDEEEDEEEDSEDSEDEDKKKFPFQKDKDEMSVIREELAKKKRKKKKMSYGWSIDESLTAAAIPVLPSTDSFLEPVFEGPTPLTVTKDGKVFGHLALFNTCHIGFPGTCVKPPKGSTYQYFHTGQIETAEGDLVEVGKLTFKTGHASMQANPRVASEHYDNTGAVAADVRAGEDKYGIWVAGALRPHLSDEDIREFRAAPLSGDWRRIAGRLELVGALAVNVPGFPVPRVRAMVASGETETLITFLEDDSEEFPSLYELNLRQNKKVLLASQVSFALGDGETEIPENDLPEVPSSKKSMKEVAESLTKTELFNYLKDLRALLDDPEEKMTKKVREGLEQLYGAFIKIEDGKKFSATGYDLSIVENSGLTYDEWEEELVLSGLAVEEFYNQCHDEDGRFCEGQDGPGRVRDNVAGKHPIPGNPHAPHPRNPGQHYHSSPYSGGGSSGPSGPSGPRSSGPSGPSGPRSSGPGGNPPATVDPGLYESYIRGGRMARGWAAAGIIATAALSSPISGFLQGLTQAVGVGILGNPLVLGLIIGTAAHQTVRYVRGARQARSEYNAQVARKLRVDQANAQANRIRQRALRYP